MNFQSRERNGAFGLAARVGERARGADGPKSGVERRIWKFIKGASPGEPSLAGFGGVVCCKGKPKPASLGDRAGQWGENATMPTLYLCIDGKLMEAVPSAYLQSFTQR